MFGEAGDMDRGQPCQESAGEQTYHRLFETVSDAIVIFDAETFRLIDMNEAAMRMYGYSREEFLALSCMAMTAEPAISEESVRMTISGTLQRVMLRYHKRKDGSTFPAEISSSSFVAGGRKVVCGVVRDISDRMRIEQQVEQYQEQLRALAAEMVLVEERERRRLADDLHDDLLQNLVLVKMKMERLRADASGANLKQSLEAVEQLIAELIRSGRSMTFELCPRSLYELGFLPAVQQLAENMTRKYGLKITLNDDGEPKPMEERSRVMLFRCLREILINVARHAQVARAQVIVSREGQWIRVSVEDEGKGFDPQTIALSADGGGFGLFSIYERLGYLGGRMQVQSAPGRGTRVIMEAPVSSEAQGHGPHEDGVP
jgi:PAS domain S-box-containing protein